MHCTANEIDDRSQWDLDAEAQPERDSDRGWCAKCESHVRVRREAILGS
jgi:hypothetical protein